MGRPGRLALAAIIVCALSATAAAPAQDARTSRTLLHFGDSLAVGTGVFLPDRLAGWSLTQSFGISRHADEAPAGLRSYGAALPHVIVISLGTNDDPGAASRFAHTLGAVVRIAGPDRCVIWSTIVRPPYNGVSYEGYNKALRRTARTHRRFRLLDWQAMAQAHPQWFAADGVHPSASGYRARAAALAHLARSCP